MTAVPTQGGEAAYKGFNDHKLLVDGKHVLHNFSNFNGIFMAQSLTKINRCFACVQFANGGRQYEF